MRILSAKEFKRKPDIINSKIIETPDSYLAGEDLSIIFPKRWLDNAAYLANIGINISIVGILCIIDENLNYSITKIPTRIITNPNRITDLRIDDIDYKEMYYSRGEQIICNRDIVKDNGDIFTLFSEFYFKANIPWYIDYEELDDIFINADKFAGSKVGENRMAIELMTSIVAKDSRDMTIPYRLAVNKNPNAVPAYAKLMSPLFTIMSTFGRIGGSHAKDGRIAALIDPSTNRENKIERILRA